MRLAEKLDWKGLTAIGLLPGGSTHLCKHNYKSYKIEINVMITFLNLLTVWTLTFFALLANFLVMPIPRAKTSAERLKELIINSSVKLTSCKLSVILVRFE
jgi:hypothetical protein